MHRRQECGSRLGAVTETDCSSALASAFNAAPENDWKALIRRDDSDAIMLSTPPTAHAEVALAAMRAGKHVFCEKPLAKIVEECRRRGRVPTNDSRTGNDPASSGVGIQLSLLRLRGEGP